MERRSLPLATNLTLKSCRLSTRDCRTAGSSERKHPDTHLSQSSDLLHGDVEPVKVQGFPAHRRQVGHAHGLLFGKGQVTIYPDLPLRLPAQLIEFGDLLVGRSRGTGLLGERKRLSGLSNTKPASGFKAAAS